jgi:hypothetical protein
MIVFQEEPDPIFVAIVHEALKFVRDVQLVCYREDYRPTRRERQELDESYGDLFPELARFFSRPRLVRMIERLLRASRDEQRWHRLTDYHWLVLYSCLQSGAQSAPRTRRAGRTLIGRRGRQNVIPLMRATSSMLRRRTVEDHAR